MTKSWLVIYLFLFTVTAWKVKANPTKKVCAEKEKSLAQLELAKDSITKVKQMFPDCNGNSTETSTSKCGAKEKSSAYIDLALQLIEGAKEHFPTCDVIVNPKEDNKDKDDEKPDPIVLYVDCLDALQRGQNESGVYRIQLGNSSAVNESLDVYCDMDTDGGGWTVIQRRGKFSSPPVDFYRDWNSYKDGFGNIKEEFWLGNDNIYQLTNRDNQSIRFDLRAIGGERRYATYNTFRIDDEENNFKLHIKGYNGTAGETMSELDQKLFSTKDKINNGRRRYRVACIVEWQSGWWFDSCINCNPNSRYLPGKPDVNKLCTYCDSWNADFDCFTEFVEIKLRRKDA